MNETLGNCYNNNNEKLFKKVLTVTKICIIIVIANETTKQF